MSTGSGHPDDRDALTPEERALADRLARLGPQGEPSPALDARILAAARGASPAPAGNATHATRRRARRRGGPQARLGAASARGSSATAAGPNSVATVRAKPASSRWR